MGLDMFLTAKLHLADYDFAPAERETAKQIYAALRIPQNLLEPSGTVSVDMPVGYWRKANAIHAWFVENVQGGEDECREAYVSEEQLQSLEQICRRVLENRAEAPNLLPTQSGFFFGGTDYDEWYWRNVEETLATIERAKTLKEQNPAISLYYRSSW